MAYGDQHMSRPRRGQVVLFSAAIVLVVSACGGDDDADTTVASTTTTATAAVTTTAAAVATTTTTSTEPLTAGPLVEPTATFNGSGCDYSGPTEFDINSTVTFTVTNKSDTTDVGFAILTLPEGTTPEEIREKGISEVTGPEETSPYKIYDGALRFAPTAIGTPYEVTVTFDTLGQHGINCFDLSGGEHDGDGLDYMTLFTVNE